MKIERTLNLLDGAPKGIAMVLTDLEWDDVSYIAQCFELTFDRVPFNTDDVTKRRLALCKRIIEASK
jgi:hypothetical protein